MIEELEYAPRPQQSQRARWEQILDVQRAHRWDLERLCSGRVVLVPDSAMGMAGLRVQPIGDPSYRAVGASLA